MTSVLRRTSSFTAHEKPVAGDIKMSFVGYDHLGWIKCDGRSLSTAQFNFLFQVLGYTFGGSGDTFNLPDPQGKVTGSVNVTYPAGTDIGEATHTLTIAEMPAHNHGTDASNNVVGNNLTGAAGAHTHSITDPGHTHTHNGTGPLGDGYGLMFQNGQNTANSVDNSPNEPNLYTSIAALNINTATTGISVNPVGNHQHSITTQGGGQPHNNIQPTLFIGNTFIYTGIPTYPGFPPNPAAAWPFAKGLAPPLI